jgi:hypothetical protein
LCAKFCQDCWEGAKSEKEENKKNQADKAVFLRKWNFGIQIRLLHRKSKKKLPGMSILQLHVDTFLRKRSLLPKEI